MRTDREIQRDILSSLDWEPGIDPADVGVTVDEGMATLRGTVRTALERSTAERAASQVYGVSGVVNALIVDPGEQNRKTDAELALDANHALASDSAVPVQAIDIAVRDGWVTLTGSVEWQFQRAAAQVAIERLDGVRGVNNDIQLAPRANARDVRAQIERAFKRSAVIDAARVQAQAVDGHVTLTGTVRSLAERMEAEQAAWNAPGVKHVDNLLHVTIE